MTGAALLAVLAFPVNSPAHVLHMNAAVISLAGKVAGRMTIQTARMFQNRNHCQKSLARAGVVFLSGGFGSGPATLTTAHASIGRAITPSAMMNKSYD